MTHILHTSTVHKTASLADEGNSVNCQSSGAHNIIHYINLWKLALRGHLNTDEQARDRIRKFFSHENDALTTLPQLHLALYSPYHGNSSCERLKTLNK